MNSFGMNRIAIGTVQFGMPYGIANQSGQVSAAEVENILTYAASNGCDTLDTAVAYGTSERILGECGVAGWRIISKIPALQPNIKDVRGYVFRTLEKSLENLKISSLHGLLVHNSPDLTSPAGEAIFRALNELKAQGLIAKAGVSIYEPEFMQKIPADFHFDIVQTPFNVLDRRLIDSGLLTTLKDATVEVHVRSIFLQGLLLMSKKQQLEKFSRWSSLWQRFHAWLAAKKMTALQACLGFALSFDGIEKIVVGVDGLQQLKEICGTVARGALKDIPNEMRCDDQDLLTPSNWSRI